MRYQLRERERMGAIGRGGRGVHSDTLGRGFIGAERGGGGKIVAKMERKCECARIKGPTSW